MFTLICVTRASDSKEILINPSHIVSVETSVDRSNILSAIDLVGKPKLVVRESGAEINDRMRQAAIVQNVSTGY